MSSYRVIDYSIDNLSRIFSAGSDCSPSVIRDKLHLIYFEGYFKKLDAQSIVVEDEYVDRDYLEDFSSYYVKCFNSYVRFCKRLHFFTIPLTPDSFKQLLLQKDSTVTSDDLQIAYLGFIVIKPLPFTFIGRTCLKTYPFEGRRHFPFIRDYKVNLYGLSLHVNSIAFQEQDSTVAACASSAIWSAFQVTGMIFQHSIPTPVEITKAATKYFPYSNRHFPNKGLTAEQMAHAIRNVGLDPFLINANEYERVKSAVYAYQKASIPLVLGMELVTIQNGKSIPLGGHAVTVTGYSLGGAISQFKNENFFLTSSKIDKIYVHDDQIGPFARMELNRNDSCLSTSWTDQSGNIGNTVGKPEIFIIPLYPKLRIPFDAILKIIYKLDETLKVIDKQVQKGIANIEWDIFLSKSNELKSEVLVNQELDDNIKLDILKSNMPKYVWRSIAHLKQDKIELIFDSTDLEQGEIFIRIIPYSKSLTDLFHTIAKGIIPDNISYVPLRKIFIELSK